MSINKTDIFGSFNEQLDESTLTKIENIYKNITPTSEFEFMFFKSTKENEIMYSEHFIKILKYLSAKSKQASLPLNNMITLDINYTSPDKTTYRITISTAESINKIIKLLHNRNNHVIFSTLIKLHKNDKTITLMKKSKNLKNIVNIDEFDMKLRLAEETKLTNQEIETLSNLPNTEHKNIMFRYKQRVSLQMESNKDVNISIDLTNIKTSRNINNLEQVPSTYELEIDLSAKKSALQKTYLTNIYGIITTLLKLIQESNFIIKKSLQHEVLVNYANLLGLNVNSITTLEGRQPISLEIQYVVDKLPDKYAVTDKADGDRYVLITYKNATFLISTLLHVKNTGIIFKDGKYNDSLLDGELIFIKSAGRHVFMCFDCIYFCNKDTRQISFLYERLKHADDLIENCYILKSQIGYKIKEYGKTFDMNNIMKYYDEDITQCMKALNLDIGKEKMYLLVRRKYFIFVQGGQSNEIFKYSDLIWNKYTKDKETNCPYLLDGLIYQPVDQKYITDAKLSKFPDYKWKPSEKNSIDFYILFERDRKTNNIVTLYDNSNVDSENNNGEEGQLRNKPYKIIKLYVGKSGKDGIESPVIFEPEKDSVKHLAYLYLQDNEVRDISGNIIQDGTVVEFYYNTDPNVPEKYRWVPIKTRHDKTEVVIRFKKKYGNYSTVANIIWRSIKNPFTMNDINILSKDTLYSKHNNILRSKIDHSIILSEKQENEYFQVKARLAKPMRNFNNWVKSTLIYTYINSVYEQDNKQLSAMDIGCGKGVDTMKYYYGKVEFCINIDLDINALLSPIDGAISRYNQMKKTHANFPRMYFIHADASALLEYEEQKIALGGMSDQNKEMMLKLFSQGNKMKVDRINCQKIHQFLMSETSWDNFCNNINDFLSPGGFFMGTCFDGDKIIDILKDKKNYSVYYTNNKGEQNMLFDIVKKYDVNNIDKEFKIGSPIDYHNSFEMQEGSYNTEYLVQIKFLEKEFLEKCNMELIDSGLFEELYVMQKDFFDDASKYESKAETKKFFDDVAEYYTDKSEINTACKKLTGLMRYFVFRKKDDKNKNTKNNKDDEPNKNIKNKVEEVKNKNKNKNKKQKGGDINTNKQFIDSNYKIKSKQLTKREFLNANEYSFFTCIHDILQNNKIIPNELQMEEFYRDVDIDICIDKNVDKSIVDTMNNNLVIKHDYSDDNDSEVAFAGVNIIIVKENNIESLGKIDSSLPTILLYFDGTKYYVLYDKNNGIFDPKNIFIKKLIK